MKSKILSKVLITALLLVSSATDALTQSVKKEEHQRTANASQTEDNAALNSPNQQETFGVVLSSKQPQPVQPSALTPSSYSRFIDPINGLTADDLARYAIAHNGELAAARQMIAEARGRLKQAGLRANPMVESSGTHAVTTSDNMTMIGAELPLELGGRRNARVEVAQREIELREAEVADFERKVAAEVRMKYADAISAARNLKFTEDLLMLTRDSHRLVQARVERGKSAPLEQNVVFVELSRVDAMRINFEGKTEVALFELKKTIGMQPAEPLQLRGEFDTNRQPAPQSDAIRNALASRPDVLAARAAETLAQAQIEQARVEGKVDASIFANYQRQNMGFGVRGFNDAGALAPVQGIFHYATFGIRLSLPVRNKNQGNIDAAIAAAEAARSKREFNEVVVRNEVASAYARFERAQAALAVYRDNVRDQAQRNLNVVQQTYTLGQRSLLDYLNEQRRFVDVETGYTDALKEYFDSLIEIERAAGAPIPTA
jgi:cobalt-zinc-cadmium efflux system outer membrane protein